MPRRAVPEVRQLGRVVGTRHFREVPRRRGDPAWIAKSTVATLMGDAARHQSETPASWNPRAAPIAIQLDADGARVLGLWVPRRRRRAEHGSPRRGPREGSGVPHPNPQWCDPEERCLLSTWTEWQIDSQLTRHSGSSNSQAVRRVRACGDPLQGEGSRVPRRDEPQLRLQVAWFPSALPGPGKASAPFAPT